MPPSAPVNELEPTLTTSRRAVLIAEREATHRTLVTERGRTGPRPGRPARGPDAGSEGSSVSTTTYAGDMSTTIDPAVAAQVNALADLARVASRRLALMSRAEKDAALLHLADAVEAATPAVLAANSEDLERGRSQGMSESLQDRLRLNEDRVAAVAQALRDVAALPDPVGEIVRGSTLANGLQIRQVRVPMGVIGMIYEARPNVTVDAAGLGLKSGNAVILRGGSAAASSNEVIVDVLSQALVAQRLPGALVQSIDAWGREGAVALMHARGLVDLLVPRGGADLIQTVVRESTVPVVETG